MQPFPFVAWKVFEMRRGPLRDGAVDAERDLTVNRPCLPVVTRDEESGAGRVDAWRGKQLLAVRDNSRAMPPEVVVPLQGLHAYPRRGRFVVGKTRAGKCSLEN